MHKEVFMKLSRQAVLLFILMAGNSLLSSATLKGSVRFQGKPGKSKMIRMEADAACLGLHPKGMASDQQVVNPDGTLQNVLVYVASGLEGKTFPAPKTPAVLDQKGCWYAPHILGVQTGQPILIKNSDATAHNIHPLPKKNPSFNLSQPKQNMETAKVFNNPEIIPVKCDIHPWMKSYIGVMSHPFFSVSGKSGSFELKDLPAGAYEIEAWHEKLGTSRQKITVGAAETKTINFSFMPKASAK